MTKEAPNGNQERLHAQLRQLILMRETGPKRAAWHAARARLIWRLHAEIQQEVQPDPAREDDKVNAPCHLVILSFRQ